MTIRLHSTTLVPSALSFPTSATHAPIRSSRSRRSRPRCASSFTNPLLVDDQNRVIAGHRRLAATQSVSAAEVPVIVVAWLTDAQRRALVLADNKLALNAGWDAGTLAEELQALKDDGFEMLLTGFSMAEIDDR